MLDDRDTIVDPQIRREVQRPRPDTRRAALLIGIVVTSTLAGATAMALVFASRTSRPAARPPTTAPAPTRAAPTATPRPCPSYGQRHHDGDEPAVRNDCGDRPDL